MKSQSAVDGIWAAVDRFHNSNNFERDLALDALTFVTMGARHPDEPKRIVAKFKDYRRGCRFSQRVTEREDRFIAYLTKKYPIKYCELGLLLDYAFRKK